MEGKEAVAMLGATLFILIYALLLSHPYPIHRIHPIHASRSAYVTLNLVGTGLLSNVDIHIAGKGINITTPVELYYYPRIYAGLNSTPIASNSSASVSSLIPFGLSGSKSIIYADLYSNTTYRITAKGSSRPYCTASEICPMYILLVNESANVTTGGPGTDTNVTMRIV